MAVHPEASKSRDTSALFAQIYAAFNRRDVAGTLIFMSDDVSWPKASEGGRVVGKDEVGAYWRRQWEEFDPLVEPLEAIYSEAGTIDVRVHQVVKSLAGDMLSDGEVWHRYTIANGQIVRMDVGKEEASSEQGPSSAFARR